MADSAMRRCCPPPEFDECGDFPKRCPSELLKAKLMPVLKPGKWRVLHARLDERLVRKTVQEYKFTTLGCEATSCRQHIF